MLNAVLTLISIHFLISAQNNSSCGYSRRMNRQIHAGDVLPAYLLSVKICPGFVPGSSGRVPGIFSCNIAVFYWSFLNYTNFFIIVQDLYR